MLTLLAIFALPIAFFSGGVAINSFRAGERQMAVKSGTVFAVCMAIFLIAPKPGPWDGDADCYIDWNGRDNRTVCN